MKTTLVEFKPMKAIIIYSSGHGNHYLEGRDLVKTDKGLVWGAGKPFDKNELKLLKLKIDDNGFKSLELKGIMPANVLYYQPSIMGDRYAWSIPAGKHYLKFDGKQANGTYNLPGLVFAVSKQTLYCFAYIDEKVTLKTKLYEAPLPNIYNSGAVCMGDIADSKKRDYLEDEMKRWEDRFFGGKFTNAHSTDRVKDGYNLSTVLTSSMTRPFDVNSLRSYKTVDAFIKDLKGGMND